MQVQSYRYANPLGGSLLRVPFTPKTCFYCQLRFLCVDASHSVS